MVDVERTALPGIGIRHVVVTDQGQRVGVISYRSGRRDLLVYDPDDPDSTLECLPLSAEEADVVSELLGVSRIVERFADLDRQVEGIVTVRVPIPTSSPYDGQPLSATRARTRTAASIVAVVRDSEVITSPRPDFVFHANDIIVAVGTHEGTAALADIIEHG